MRGDTHVDKHLDTSVDCIRLKQGVIMICRHKQIRTKEN